jgi:hypothetical protein
VVVFVERGGGIVDRVDHDDPATALAGGADDAFQRVDEKLAAEALPVECSIDRGSAEQVARDGGVAPGLLREGSSSRRSTVGAIE